MRLGTVVFFNIFSDEKLEYLCFVDNYNESIYYISGEGIVYFWGNHANADFRKHFEEL